jgi:hypothetical protein
MSSEQSSRDPHEQTHSYYGANAERFFHNTRRLDEGVGAAGVISHGFTP